jgi:bifunctional non-homologous end joining protein LigD
MLATGVDAPFNREGWFFELKYDGVRVWLTVRAGKVTLTGRHGRDETRRYPELQRAAAAVGGRDCVLDGEVCVLDADGRPSFERLQSRINVDRDQDVQRAMRDAPVVMFAFDILELDGRSLLDTSLRIRKKTLRDVLRDGHGVVFADHVERDGEEFFRQVQRAGVEGMVAKRADSLYVPGRRSIDWVKVKAWHTQSCVIAGYTAGQGKRKEHLGALILAVMRDGELKHCGQVGTGFDEKMLRRIRQSLEPLVIERSALRPAPRTTEPATWVTPQLCCEVRFAGWTNAGILRHPAFTGLRPELLPADCVPDSEEHTLEIVGNDDRSRGEGSVPRGDNRVVRGASRKIAETASDEKISSRERNAALTAAAAASPDDVERALHQLRTLRGNDHWEVGGRRLALTNLDKVLWPDDSFTKRDMIAYYVRMHAYLLPYLRDRPLSMQVFPDGISGKSFWRKDKPSYAPKWMDSWTYHGEKTKEYIVVNEVATLAWVANAGVVDLHPWHSRIDAPDQPDWAVFDLDPFEPATFADIVDIAKLVKAALDYYQLRGVVKTSGQTGLQIYVPLRRGPNYEEVRNWVEEVGRAIGRTDPKNRITWEWTVSHRGGKIRIDYTQNIINKTLAAPYSLRPAKSAPVSAPIAWEELDDRKLRPDRWTMRTIAQRVEQTGDLFLPVLDGDQSLPVRR